MGRLVGPLVLVLVLAVPSLVWASRAQVTDHGGKSPQVHVQASPRVRASSPAIAKAIEQALDQSPTFKQLMTAITATDGIVYVHHGECGRNVRACLLLGSHSGRAEPDSSYQSRSSAQRTGPDGGGRS